MDRFSINRSDSDQFNKSYFIDKTNERILVFEGDKEVANIACKVLEREDGWGFSELIHNLDYWRWKKVDFTRWRKTIDKYRQLNRTHRLK